MNLMTYPKPKFREIFPNPFASKGFALVVTLSGVALPSSSQQSAQTTARANARMALMLAIGELQRATGSDQRITITSSLRTGGEPANPNGTGSVDVSPGALTSAAKSAPIRICRFFDVPPKESGNA